MKFIIIIYTTNKLTVVEMEDIRGVRLRKFKFKFSSTKIKKNCIRGKDAFSSHNFWCVDGKVAEIVCYTLCPEKSAPEVKYHIVSITRNIEQKSLKITDNTLTSMSTLCAKLQLSSVSGS